MASPNTAKSWCELTPNISGEAWTGPSTDGLICKEEEGTRTQAPADFLLAF